MGALNRLVKPRLPVINYGNPITRGLVFDAPMFEGSGTTTEDDAGSLIDKILGTITSATWDRNLLGIDLDFSTAGSLINFTLPINPNLSGQLSFECYFYYRTFVTNGRLFENAAVDTGIKAFTPDAGQLRLQVDFGTTIGFWDTTVAVGNWYHWIITYDTTSVNNAPIPYLNGLRTTLSNNQQPVGTNPASNNKFYIGNRADGTRTFNGKIVYSRIWNRILSAKEVLMLYTNPWRIYRQSNPNFPRAYH